MDNFFNKALLRIIPVLAGYLVTICATNPEWHFLKDASKTPGSLAHFVVQNQQPVSIAVAFILYLIVEFILSRVTVRDLTKVQKQMADALFEGWRKEASITDNTGAKIFPGLRINIMLIKWPAVQKCRWPFFRKSWVFIYRDKDRMRQDPDIQMKLRFHQGWVGESCQTRRSGFPHFLDLRQYSADDKKTYLKDSLKMTLKQRTDTDHLKAITTVFLINKRHKIFGALNVDAYNDDGAVYLEFPEVQQSIVDLAKFAEALYGDGVGGG